VGSRAATQKTGERVGLAQLLLLFPSLLVVRATITCERRNPHKHPVDFKFFFLRRSVLGSVVLFLLFFPSSSKRQL
jgi:hypothetical protein